MPQISCPNCGILNSESAQRCMKCGANLTPQRIPFSSGTPAPPKSLWQKIADWLAKPVEIDPKRILKSRPPGERPDTRVIPIAIADGQQPPTSQRVPSQPGSNGSASSPRTTVAPSQLAPTFSSSSAVMPPLAASVKEQLQPFATGSFLNYSDGRVQYSYLITSVARLTHSTYYHALDMVCRRCQRVAAYANVAPSADFLCPHCQAPLQPVLIHEHAVAERPAISPRIPELLNLSQECPGVLKHHAIIAYDRIVYAVTDHPGKWGVVVRGRQQRSLDQSLAAVIQLGRLIEVLHSRGFTFSGKAAVLRESLVNVGGATELFLADLGICELLTTDLTQAHRQRSADIVFLTELLVYLLTGKEISSSPSPVLPEPLLPVLQHALRSEYAAVGDLLRDFGSFPVTSLPDRPLKPMHGQRSDVGRRHTINEDTVVTFTFDKEQDRKTVPIGFYLIADGMGGHDAGNVASRTVYEVVTSTILNMQVLPDIHKATRKLGADVSGDLLKHAIQEANAKLQRQAQARGNDMGSTVTAALLIGHLATVANVGDSRTYLLRKGRLEQITQDHSLVARLVDAQVIKPEQARYHPQRNQIYRSLGQKGDLVVDTFTVPLERGDRLILCCDGLWSMVEERDIQQLVEQARTPQDACDALVAAANRAGGEDNISAIVVELV